MDLPAVEHGLIGPRAHVENVETERFRWVIYGGDKPAVNDRATIRRPVRLRYAVVGVQRFERETRLEIHYEQLNAADA